MLVLHQRLNTGIIAAYACNVQEAGSFPTLNSADQGSDYPKWAVFSRTEERHLFSLPDLQGVEGLLHIKINFHSQEYYNTLSKFIFFHIKQL